VSDPLEALATIASDSWLVGGAVRDRLLGRATSDFDIAVASDAGPLAQKLARSTRGYPFSLSETFGAWRVVASDRSWQVDLLPLNGTTIEEDLRRRDLTINAIAQRLDSGSYIDPFGGIEDLRRRRLRTVSTEAFEDDPLRTMRVARIACELGFEPDPETANLAARSASSLRKIAPERIFSELKLIVCAGGVLDGLALIDRLGVTSVILPELSGLRGIEQSRYHHLDVHEHTRAVLTELLALEHDPGHVFGQYAEAVTEVLEEPLANELTRAQSLRFGALFHDVAKPTTRDVTPQGRVTFIGHDATGAGMAAAALRRLRASDRLCEYVADVTRHHLRLGFLVHEMPLSRRAVYRYLKACEPVQVDVTVLSVADRVATRGAGSEQAISRHVELARALIGDALQWRLRPPRAPVRGDELARALGIPTGPEVGRLLAELEEAEFAGELAGPEQAFDRARQLLAAKGADRDQ
jgi:poly(A) polymerase